MRSALVLVLLGLACARDPRCVPGASTPCACDDGRGGAQLCRADGTLAPCACLAAAIAAPTVEHDEKKPDAAAIAAPAVMPVAAPRRPSQRPRAAIPTPATAPAPAAPVEPPAQRGTVTVTASPPCLVWVARQARGDSPVGPIELPPGDYPVACVRPGGGPARTAIAHVEAGRETRLSL